MGGRGNQWDPNLLAVRCKATLYPYVGFRAIRGCFPVHFITPKEDSTVMSEAIHVKCVMCDMGWTIRDDQPRGPCPHCDEKNWDVEPDLSQFVGERTEYRITEQRIDEHRIMHLGLTSIWNPDNNAEVRLSHRLKSKLRKDSSDMPDTQHRGALGLIVTFQKSNGLWDISTRNPTSFEIRKERTDRCGLHQWAIGIFEKNFPINLRADLLYQCVCPQDPPCHVCELAAQLAKARANKGGETEASRLYIELDTAVRQDLGRIR